MLIGLALVLGAFSRFAAVSGIVLLSLYYVASPPLVGLPTNGAEGSYLIVNKNLVEILALCVVAAFPAHGFFGLERRLAGLLARRGEARRRGPPRPATARPLAARAPSPPPPASPSSAASSTPSSASAGSTATRPGSSARPAPRWTR